MTNPRSSMEGYQGMHLSFSHNYRRAPQNGALESDFVQMLGFLIMDDGDLALFHERFSAFYERFRHEGWHDSHLGEAIGTCLTCFSPMYGYHEEDIYGRLLDIWNWIAYSHNMEILQDVETRLVESQSTEKIEIVQHVPLIDRKSGLLMVDVLERLGMVARYELSLLDFFNWLNNPLMLWECILTRELDPRLYALLEKIQHYWYISRYEGYAEIDVLGQFQRLVASYDMEMVLSFLKE